MNASANPAGARLAGRVVWLDKLASLKLTAVAIAWLVLAVAYSFHTGAAATWSLAAPLGLLALNLGAAIASNPVFRRQSSLLAFHLALLALIALVALGRLTYLKGTLELSEGETFAGALIESEAGPLHRWRLDHAAFTNAGFEIDYAPGMRRGDTRNRVRWQDDQGAEHESVIGDQTPLILEGYRFYTTPNKGFAPVFLWQPGTGAPRRGTVHLPPYPVFQFGQALEWNLPDGGETLRISLEFDEVLIDFEKSSRFRLPADHVLQVETAGKKLPLRPGGTIEISGGALRYEGLTTWMGYTVFYDWTLPWLLASALLAVACLAWHYRAKFAAQPWSH